MKWNEIKSCRGPSSGSVCLRWCWQDVVSGRNCTAAWPAVQPEAPSSSPWHRPEHVHPPPSSLLKRVIHRNNLHPVSWHGLGRATNWHTWAQSRKVPENELSREPGRAAGNHTWSIHHAVGILLANEILDTWKWNCIGRWLQHHSCTTTKAQSEPRRFVWSCLQRQHSLSDGQQVFTV